MRELWVVSPELVFELVRAALWAAMLIAAPGLLAMLVVALVISLLQAVTQIQEMTLTLLPKLLALAAALVVTMPFMWAVLRNLGERMFREIAALGGV